MYSCEKIGNPYRSCKDQDSSPQHFAQESNLEFFSLKNTTSNCARKHTALCFRPKRFSHILILSRSETCTESAPAKPNALQNLFICWL